MHPGGRAVLQIEAITESAQHCGCSQDLRGVVPASPNDAVSTTRLALREKEALTRRLIDLFLTCVSSLDNVVTPTHNHQIGSTRIEISSECGFVRNRLQFAFAKPVRCRLDESGFAPRLHFECESTRKTCAIVERP